MEVASEFILVAATLMRIKAKMLLPRPSLDEEGNEVDPREELIKHLIEYKRYKSVIGTFSEMEVERQLLERRGNISMEIKNLAENVDVESELQDVDLYKLLKVYQKVLDRFEIEKNKPTHEVIQYPYTIAQQKEFILDSLKEKERLSFEDIIRQEPSKIGVIFNFLAVLELLQLSQIIINLGLGYNNFWIGRPGTNIKKKEIKK
jgi:segregation and condensation protein A